MRAFLCFVTKVCGKIRLAGSCAWTASLLDYILDLTVGYHLKKIEDIKYIVQNYVRCFTFSLGPFNFVLIVRTQSCTCKGVPNATGRPSQVVVSLLHVLDLLPGHRQLLQRRLFLIRLTEGKHVARHNFLPSEQLPRRRAVHGENGRDHGRLLLQGEDVALVPGDALHVGGLRRGLVYIGGKRWVCWQFSEGFRIIGRWLRFDICKM